MRLRGEILHEKGDDSCFLVGHVQVQVGVGDTVPFEKMNMFLNEYSGFSKKEYFEWVFWTLEK